LRAALITFAILIIILFAYAQIVRRSSMFFPAKFPLGDWHTTAEDVHFTSGGVALHGWFYRSGEPLLIFFHGNAGNITERASEATELAHRGISVLLFDWRGYGKSEGTPTESALFDDALAAYDFARTKTSGDIVLYGESLGGPYAAYVATKRKARCVIIENSFPSLSAIGNALYRPVPLGLFAPFALTTTRWLNQAGLPVLVMHGKQDQVIPFQLGMDLYNGLRVRKQLLVSENAGHCELAAVEGARYYDAIVEFIRTTSRASN
jgi:fermentation-respiration switch protein FrsA (DUF1100 family)